MTWKPQEPKDKPKFILRWLQGKREPSYNRAADYLLLKGRGFL